MSLLIYSSLVAAQWLYGTDTLQLQLFIMHFFRVMQWLLCQCVCACVCGCVWVCVCVLHASVFPKESTRTASAVSPYKDVCLWKEGRRKRRERRTGGIEGEEE